MAEGYQLSNRFVAKYLDERVPNSESMVSAWAVKWRRVRIDDVVLFHRESPEMWR